MNEQFIPLDLVLEASRVLHEDCQRSFKGKLYKLIADEKPEQPPPAVAEKIRSPFPPIAPLFTLLMEVAIRHNMTREAIIAHCNQRPFVKARQEFCVMARLRGYSLHTIGRILQRHHTTVLYLTKVARKP